MAPSISSRNQPLRLGPHGPEPVVIDPTGPFGNSDPLGTLNACLATGMDLPDAISALYGVDPDYALRAVHAHFMTLDLSDADEDGMVITDIA